MNFISNRLAAQQPLFFPEAEAEPRFVCWSRMQAEAGQALEAIIRRKELERQANDGVFAWGVGNAPARLTSELVRAQQPVQAIFSIMKSKPRVRDAAPEEVLLWRSYIDVQGAERPLPDGTVVTSRGGTAASAKRAHYALLCYSGRPLALSRGRARFDPRAFRNAGANGRPVGASQVTALLEQIVQPSSEAGAYEVNMEAKLWDSYWVRLTSPVRLARAARSALDYAETMSLSAWRDLARTLRGDASRNAGPVQGALAGIP